MFRIRNNKIIGSSALNCRKNEMHYKIKDQQDNRVESFYSIYDWELGWFLACPYAVDVANTSFTLHLFPVTLKILLKKGGKRV